MPAVNCAVCQKEFYAKPSWLKRGKGKFCSADCFSSFRKQGEIIKCFTCGQEVYKSQKDLKNSKSKNYFCSKKCSLAWNNSLHFGVQSVNWKGGRFSYKKILERTSLPKVCVLCGKDKLKILSVHHIDQNRRNNEISNLAWLCQNCHFLVHHYSEEKQKLLKIYANR